MACGFCLGLLEVLLGNSRVFRVATSPTLCRAQNQENWEIPLSE